MAGISGATKASADSTAEIGPSKEASQQENGGLLANRWFGLAAASWVESCAGVAYMFSLYSQSFRDNLGYSQTMVDMVGMAKDLGGNVGIVSGFVGDLCPPSVALAIGAIQNFVGYFGTWLALTGRIHNAPFWLVMVMICLGTNGATFFNTAGMVTCVKNFPNSRGPIVGLLKGYIGLSGALFTQLYLAFYAPDKDSFILMTAWFPAIIAVLAMPAIHNLPSPAFEAHERERLLLILWCSVCTALFLLGATILGHFVSISRLLCFSVAAIVLTALASPALVALSQLREGRAEGELGSSGADADGDTEGQTQPLLREEKAPLENAREKRQPNLRLRSPAISDDEDVQGSEGNHSIQDRKGPTDAMRPLSSPASDPTVQVPASRLAVPPPFPKVGEDHSLLQAVRTLPFWLIYLAMTGASGSGLTAINNLGQFGRSMGYGQNEIGVFVSLMSIWNFLGRVGAGYASEFFFHEMGTPRPLFMFLTQLVMAVGHLVFASAFPGSLYIGSVLVGLTYGAQWGLMPAIASEIFGLKYFGTLYNWLTITNPTGSYLLSVCVAGYLYDYEAEQEASPPAPLAGSAPSGQFAPTSAGPKACNGAHCFRETFLIMSFSCLVAAGLSGCLTLLTSKYYSREYVAEHSRKPSVVSSIDTDMLVT